MITWYDNKTLNLALLIPHKLTNTLYGVYNFNVNITGSNYKTNSTYRHIGCCY